MASESGGDGRSVSERLAQEPGRFNFFQAVRILERMSLVQSRRAHGPRRGRVGEDAAPAEETVRFRSLPSHAFPAVDVHSVRSTSGRRVDNAPGPPPELFVTFFGLVGALGALPQHYTRLILGRDREKDSSFRDFLDLFQHRLVSLFYRSWEKSRVTEAYARRHIDPAEGEDLLTTALYSIVGMSSPAVRGASRLDSEIFLRFGGMFSDRRRNAVSLQQLLTDELSMPVEVRQFQGEWLALPQEDQSSLSGGACLGESAILGTRVWSLQSKFRLRIGPLTYADARQLLPTGNRIGQLCDLVRAYVGGEFRFDVQLVIVRDEVPACRLGRRADDPCRLGWNTWLQSRPPEHDAEDAVFEADHPAIRTQRGPSVAGTPYTVDFTPAASTR